MRTTLVVVLAIVAAALVTALILRSRESPQAGTSVPGSPAATVAGALPSAPIELPAGTAGWNATGPSARYDAQTIYSYIDGHAEVYLAYGMRSCTSRRYTGPAGESALVVDVFELASPEDAFGAFTHDRDGEVVDVGEDALFRFGWLSFWKGRYFASIVSESETPASKQAAIELGRALATTLPAEGGRPAIVGALPHDGLNLSTTRFLRHPQILNTHVFVSDDNLLDLGPDTSAALGAYRRGNARGHLLIVDYPDEARARSAEARFRTGLLGGTPAAHAVAVPDRGFFAAGRAGSRVAIVIGADTAELAAALLAEATHASAAGGTR